MSDLQLTIKPTGKNDLPAIVALERESNLSSWGMAGYERELLQPQAVLFTAYLDEKFVGFFSGRVMVDEFELYSIAVVPGFRRMGIGRKLLEAGRMELKSRAIKRWFLEVRAANISAQKMYIACGFKPLGMRRNYYHTPTDNAVTMVWEEILRDGLAQ